MSNKEQEAALNEAIARFEGALAKEASEVKDALASMQSKIDVSDSPIDLSDEIARINAAAENVGNIFQSAAVPSETAPGGEPAPGGGETAPTEETAPGETSPNETAPGGEPAPAEGETTP